MTDRPTPAPPQPDASPNPTKEQLLGAVGEHFAAQQLDEGQVIAGFLAAAKRHAMGVQRASA